MTIWEKLFIIDAILFFVLLVTAIYVFQKYKDDQVFKDDEIVLPYNIDPDFRWYQFLNINDEKELSNKEIKKFISKKDLVGAVGFSLQNVPITVLSSWGFNPKEEIIIYDSFDPDGWWIIQPIKEHNYES